MGTNATDTAGDTAVASWPIIWLTSSRGVLWLRWWFNKSLPEQSTTTVTKMDERTALMIWITWLAWGQMVDIRKTATGN